MQFRQGKKSHTVDLVYDDFRQGVNLLMTEHRHPDFGLVRGLLYGENFEITPSGEMRVRPDAATVTLHDPANAFEPITSHFIGLVPFPRLGGGQEWLAVTSEKVYRLEPNSFINLEELLLKVPLKKFDGKHANPPDKDDYTADAGSFQAIRGVSWTPDSTSVKAPLALTTLEEIAGDPETDLGTPTHYYIELGTTGQIATRSFLVHLYPIPDTAGTLCVEGPAFASPADVLDYEIYQNYAYLATGTNHLIRWDGRGNELEDVSRTFEEGWRFPSVIKRHMGRLAMSGFTDQNDTRAQSVLRFTEIAAADTLAEFLFECRTTDDDAPAALASMQSGLATTDQAVSKSTPCLLVFKRRNTLAMVGSDLAQFSDVSIGVHTPGVGCVGPQAWCYGQKGIYFMSDYGIYRIDALQPAQCVSDPVSPIFGRKPAASNVHTPRPRFQDLHQTCMWYDPDQRRVMCHIPRLLGS